MIENESGYISTPYNGAMVKGKETHRHRSANLNNVSIAELTEWCYQHELNLAETRITGGHLKWTSPMSATEEAQLATYNEAAEVRQSEWERATYQRLKAKLEPTLEKETP